MSERESERAVETFRTTYGRDPDVVASAPGRVNLIGEHTDYNGGEVLPIAIAKRTTVAIGKREIAKSRAVSADANDRGEFDFANPRKSGQWWDYISGLGPYDEPVDIAVASGVPSGAGLSSSAALQVAAAVALAAIQNRGTSPRDIALMAWRAENDFVGVSSGVMDQFASALAVEHHALHIDCSTLETENVPFRGAVLVFDTAVPRSLRNSAFNDRQRECAEALAIIRRSRPDVINLARLTPDQVNASDLPEVLKMRALHVSEETRRVQTAVEQLKKNGTIDGHLLYESHISLRDHYQCSSVELDWFVDEAMNIEGVTGARLTGAGWGGCAIALGRREALNAAGAEIARDYKKVFRREPRYWITEASFGARLDRH